MLNFLRKFIGLNDSKLNEIIPMVHNIIDDDDVLNISKVLTKIADDEKVATQTRKDTLGRTLAYIKSAEKKNRIDDNTKDFTPGLEKYQIIRVNFSGMGSELKDPHYAIVWDSERKRDGVIVIPLTSFKDSSTYESGHEFNIGKLGSFTVFSVAMMQQIVQVSRKRILKYRFSNGSREVIIRLNDFQKERVRDGFKVIGLGQKVLYEEIKNRAQDYLPVFPDPIIQYAHLFRPFEVIETSVNQLKYKISGDPQVYELDRKLINKEHYNREQLIEQWAHPFPVKDITSGEITRTRDESMQNAYQEILEAIESYIKGNESEENEVSA
jgi:acetolactate synthase small subunit